MWTVHLVLVFAGAPLVEPLSRVMGALRLDRESSRDQYGWSPVQTVQSEVARVRHTTGSVVLGPGSGLAAESYQDLCTERLQSQTGAGVDHIKVRKTTGSQLVLAGLRSIGGLRWSQQVSVGLSRSRVVSGGLSRSQQVSGGLKWSQQV